MCLLTNFRPFPRLEVLCQIIFFEKFPKISQKNSTNFQHFQIRKKFVYVSKLVQNDCINQIWPQFPLKLQGQPVFPKNSSFLRIFGAFNPKIPIFWEFELPSRRLGVSPKKISDVLPLILELGQNFGDFKKMIA